MVQLGTDRQVSLPSNCCSRRHMHRHMGQVRSNNAFERTVRHRGPRLAAAQPSWSAAQRGR